jgi:glutathione S-transferase
MPKVALRDTRKQISSGIYDFGIHEAVVLLYHFPSACSRVTMHALEAINADYDDVLVNFRTHSQAGPDYLAVNPKGKVPALAYEGQVLTENAAILWMLHEMHPTANLLPPSSNPLDRQRYLADLVWCSGTLHPMVRQVRMPMKWTTGDSAGVREHGIAALSKECELRIVQVADAWWYGDAWSIVDTYLFWAYTTAEKGGFPLDRYPVLLNHAKRVRALPSFQRVLRREQAALDRAGIDDITL